MFGQMFRGILIPILLFIMVFMPVSRILQGGNVIGPLMVGLIFIFPLLAFPAYFLLKSAQKNNDFLFRWIFKDEYLGISLLGEYESTIKELVELKKEKENEKIKAEIRKLKNETGEEKLKKAS